MDPQLAKKMQAPTGAMKVLAQFNRLTGELITVMQYVDPNTLNQEPFVYRVIEDFNFEEDEVVGTADDFKVVKTEDMPSLVSEEDLNERAREKITKRYPLAHQLSIVGDALHKLAVEAGVDLPDLEEMVGYVKEVRRENQVRKAFYRESKDYEYVTVEEASRREARRLEGGQIDPEYDPTRVGTRVF